MSNTEKVVLVTSVAASVRFGRLTSSAMWTPCRSSFAGLTLSIAGRQVRNVTMYYAVCAAVCPRAAKYKGSMSGDVQDVVTCPF